MNRITVLPTTVNGMIDDYRVYNRDLTDSEIADIYDMTKP